MRMEPPPSEPSPIMISPSATADALPPLDPPELYPGLNGVEVGPYSLLSVVPRKANAGAFVFPKAFTRHTGKSPREYRKER